MDSGIVAECAPGDFSAGASSGIVACDGPGDFFQPFFLSAFFLLRDFGLGGGSSADFFDCFGFDAFLGGDGGCLGSVSILYASWISMKRCVASSLSSRCRSGCHLSAIFLYASLTSLSDASGATPSTANASLVVVVYVGTGMSAAVG